MLTCPQALSPCHPWVVAHNLHVARWPCKLTVTASSSPWLMDGLPGATGPPLLVLMQPLYRSPVQTQGGSASGQQGHGAWGQQPTGDGNRPTTMHTYIWGQTPVEAQVRPPHCQHPDGHLGKSEQGPGSACPDSWPTETMRWYLSVALGDQVCHNTVTQQEALVQRMKEQINNFSNEKSDMTLVLARN